MDEAKREGDLAIALAGKDKLAATSVIQTALNGHVHE
jgi:hypothetical protein